MRIGLLIIFVTLSGLSPPSMADELQKEPPVSAQEAPLESAEAAGYSGRPENLKPGSLMGGALAFFPGVLVHGTGHLYTGDIGVGLGLIAAEVLGAALVIAGYYLERMSVRKPRYSPLHQTLSHAGFMLFAGSWVADMMGSFKGNAPFEPGYRNSDINHLQLSYRYTDNRLNDFRHHGGLRLEINHGRFTARPFLDLEASLSRREFGSFFGLRLLGENVGSEHLLLGTRLSRLENHSDGWSSHSGVFFLQSQLDLGRFMSTLKRFYVKNRIGYGLAGYQLSPRRNAVPSLLADTAITDSWLFLETGLVVNLNRATRLEISLLQDPNGAIAPAQLVSLFGASPEDESVRAKVTHQYAPEVLINVEFMAGEGLGAWVGLEYAL